MNILFLTHRLPYAPNRGDRIRAYYLLREMSRFADVSLFSLVHDDEEASHIPDVRFARAVATSRVSRSRNMARGALRLLSDIPLTHSLLDAPDVDTKLTTLVASARPDVVFAFCSGMARFAMKAPLDTYPFVLDMVDVDSAKWAQLGRDARGPKGWIYRREERTLRTFEAAAVSRAAMSLVVNQRERDSLRAVAPVGDIVVVENGIDTEAFRPPTPPAEIPRVIFCGVLDYAPNEAGVLWFLKAVWPGVVASRPDARFSIVGANPTSAIIQAAASDSSVDMIGAVPSVQPHLWQSAVSVAPLHLARGLQNKVLEALAAGLPVVATPVVMEGLPVEVRRGCMEAAAASDFGDAILTLLNDTPDARARRARSAHLEVLEWPQRLHALEGIMEQATSSHAGAHAE